MKNIKFEYISVIEPQGRGSFHIHEILIFAKSAVFVPNDKIEQLWGNGFTKTTKIKIVNNIGTYLTAYLCDIPIEQADFKDIKSLSDIK